MTPALAHLDIAADLGRRLAGQAYWAGNMCGWMGWGWHADHLRMVPAYVAAGHDLGSGGAGIGLFLSEIGTASGDGMMLATAQGALRAAMASPAPDGGLFVGRPGIALALVFGGEKLGDQQLVAHGRKMLAELRPVKRHALYDGTAGAIAAQLMAGSDLSASVELGRALVKAGVRDGDTLSWPTDTSQPHPNLLGLAHGVDGIAAVLAALAKASGEATFRDAANDALAYAAKGFDTARRMWPDYRVGAETPHLAASQGARFPVAWEHGATGVALSRCAVLRHMPERTETQDELNAALEAVKAVTEIGSMAYQDFSAAGGLAGHGEALLEAARAGQAGWEQRLSEISAYGAQSIVMARMPWPTAAPNRQPTPSLLTGYAGIGRFYLRLHDPDTYPCLLCPVPTEIAEPDSGSASKPEPSSSAAAKPKARARARAKPKTSSKPSAAAPRKKAAQAPKEAPADKADAKDEDTDALAKKRATRPRRPRNETAKPRSPMDGDG
ncbi:MAG: lanthionine synthetase LanC family protein [Pseudomonadota bacterium]